MKQLILGILNPYKTYGNFALLLLRLLVGICILTHGIPKIMNYDQLLTTFGDPIGMGTQFSLLLVIFAEVGCGILIILGLFTRLAAIPLIINMAVAFFVAHGNDPFQVKELPFFYMILFIILVITGAGRLSLDDLLYKKLNK